MKRAINLLTAVLVVLCCVTALTACTENKNIILHKSITGCIISYHDSDAGIVAVVDHGLIEPAHILIDENTMFVPKEIEDIIIRGEVGVLITAECEYSETGFNGNYPVILLTVAEKIT